MKVSSEKRLTVGINEQDILDMAQGHRLTLDVSDGENDWEVIEVELTDELMEVTPKHPTKVRLE